MNTLDYIIEKYEVKGQGTIELYSSRWGTLVNIFRRLGFTSGAEIGVERGRFSKIICKINPQLKLYLIDSWEVYPGYRDHVSQERLDEFYQETKNRLAGFNCQYIRDWSMSAVKRFADESLDFVFIDAAHDYEHVKEDIREWSKKVKKGGIVAGHDYMDGYRNIEYGVKQAVNEWVEENSISYLFLLVKESEDAFCPSWFYVK